MLHRVPALMPQDLHALGVCAAFDLEKLRPLELDKARMGEVEWDGDARHVARREPLVADPDVRSYAQLARVEFGVEVDDAALQPGALDADTEVLDAQLEQFLGGPRSPRKATGAGRHAGQSVRREPAECKGRESSRPVSRVPAGLFHHRDTEE